ncbi:hypothetical protein [Myxococcus landrumensis]|uniref:Uncharacterized protein n=1 Tax=Myxococcus landrumensis TaxID=2813577 RepID=A0ABX7NBD7_9BACT|nr:hypothetical protein [Myxococcus landrumus]QSQ15714.1 hypothetical protein JY572_06515 [Myxococcus landrumus]
MGALQKGHLGSAYLREEPGGTYSRAADKNGGGALGVYTRAVGTDQATWPAQGYGVGSNDSKVQPVVFTQGMASLLTTLKEANIADINGRVR